MELTGEQRIAAPRERVWEALNDPEILKQCIPGCQHIEKSDENTFSAKVKAKVGPVNSTFSGTVTLSNLNPPESYTISGEGSGGAAGFAKGSAHVELEADGDETILRYTVDAQVGGKLAQVGQRLIQSTANKYAKQFFEAFTEKVGADEAAETAAESADQPAVETVSEGEDVSGATEPAAGETGAGSVPSAGEPADTEATHAAAESTGAQPTAPDSGAEQTPDRRSGQRFGLHPKGWITLVLALVILLLAILTS
jgi:carbon monoxide dehydrogenase subunit G